MQVLCPRFAPNRVVRAVRLSIPKEFYKYHRVKALLYPVSFSFDFVHSLILPPIYHPHNVEKTWTKFLGRSNKGSTTRFLLAVKLLRCLNVWR
jgi:hypothetical protein